MRIWVLTITGLMFYFKSVEEMEEEMKGWDKDNYDWGFKEEKR